MLSIHHLSTSITTTGIERRPTCFVYRLKRRAYSEKRCGIADSGSIPISREMLYSIHPIVFRVASENQNTKRLAFYIANLIRRNYNIVGSIQYTGKLQENVL